jgi:hypothetical protein
MDLKEEHATTKANAEILPLPRSLGSGSGQNDGLKT